MQSDLIVSPVTGQVSAPPKPRKLEIYLAPEDDHQLWAPISGQLQPLEFHQLSVTKTSHLEPLYGPGRRTLLRDVVDDEMAWIKPMKRPKYRQQFEVPMAKVGRAKWTIISDQPGRPAVSFWVEVGLGWITRRVALAPPSINVIQGAGAVNVKQGELLGEIILGSMALITLPVTATLLVKYKDRVEGGQTVIATLS